MDLHVILPLDTAAIGLIHWWAPRRVTIVAYKLTLLNDSMIQARAIDSVNKKEFALVKSPPKDSSTPLQCQCTHKYCTIRANLLKYAFETLYDRVFAS